MFRKTLLLVNLFGFGFLAGAFTVSQKDNFKSTFAAISPMKVPQTAYQPPIQKPNQFIARTTAYSHLENEPGAYEDLNCLGTKLRYWKEPRSAAADWSVYPVGTRFRVEGIPYIYEVDDYGSGLVGTETLDLYCPTLELMEEWGVRNVEVEVIEWGSYERSLEVMEKRRLKYPHIAEMYRKIEEKMQRKQRPPAMSGDFVQN